MFKNTLVIVIIIIVLIAIGVSGFIILKSGGEKKEELGSPEFQEEISLPSLFPEEVTPTEPLDTSNWKVHLDETGIKFKYPENFYIDTREETNIVFKARSLPENISNFHIVFWKREYSETMNLSKLREYFPASAITDESVVFIDGVKSLRETVGDPDFQSQGFIPYHYEAIWIPYEKFVYGFETELSLSQRDEQTVTLARDYYELYLGIVDSVDLPD